MSVATLTEAVAGEAGCFHCGLPLPQDDLYHARILGQERVMCCAGCQAVARAIVAAGHESFYNLRDRPAANTQALVPAFLREAQVYDDPRVQRRFVRELDAHEREAELLLEGIRCAACVWLNERHLHAQPGVLEAEINYATQRARVRWDSRITQLSSLLKAVAAIGYLAHPYDALQAQALLERERKALLKRFLVAGLLSMQVMMSAFALYTGDWYGIAPDLRLLIEWFCAVLTVPVLFYSAAPFFAGALRDLRLQRVGMDVPVAAALLIAYLGSLWHTISGAGAVYYESVGMFVFLLLGARYLELMARRRALQESERRARLAPAQATRVVGANEETLPVADLGVGDVVRVRPGETIPADGVIIAGSSSVNEALITGESLPQLRTVGAQVIGGSVNVESPLEIRVERVGDDTLLAAVLRLVARAQGDKPAIAQLADRLAGYFVVVVLLLAVGTVFYWLNAAPQQALASVIAVLVVSCPCALSLATPAATVAAATRLMALGLLPTRARALETLAQVTQVVFDKTGTLTEGCFTLSRVVVFSGAEADWRQLAASIEAHSGHPLAQAIRAGWNGAPLAASDVHAQAGAGLSALIEGHRVVIGTAGYLVTQTGCAPTAAQTEMLDGAGCSVAWLAVDGVIVCAFLCMDRLRKDAAATVCALAEQGVRVSLLSGDRPEEVARVAAVLGIADHQGGLAPADKLARLRALQQPGAVVAMVGDGVNDAPVLAQAQVSIAIGAGAPLAAQSADAVLLGEHLTPLSEALKLARRMRGVIRQNLVWALLYNAVALPLAAVGLVPPWLAALGMSASSVLVVANAGRLARAR
jgi:Cu2+-exporting ATPase